MPLVFWLHTASIDANSCKAEGERKRKKKNSCTAGPVTRVLAGSHKHLQGKLVLVLVVASNINSPVTISVVAVAAGRMDDRTVV